MPEADYHEESDPGDAELSVTSDMTRAQLRPGGIIHQRGRLRLVSLFISSQLPWTPDNVFVMPGCGEVTPVVMGLWHASADQESGVRCAYRYFTTSSSCNMTRNELITIIRAHNSIPSGGLSLDYSESPHLWCEQLNQWQANKRIWDPR